MLLVTAKEMREIDRQTVETIGIPGIVLMENAGASVVKKIDELALKKAKVLVLSGHGNNGGDGFVVARKLANKGYDVVAWFVGDINKFSQENLINYHALVHSGCKIKFYSNDNIDGFHRVINEADIIVDALLGTGVIGDLREPIKGIVELANQTNATKISIDMPTGVNSDTGEIGSVAFKADITVTFALPKLGQFLFPGAEYVGELVIADISIPQILINNFNSKKYLINEDNIKDILPNRKANTHKGTYGHSLIIGGSRDMPGAPILSTLATLRIGSGLTTIAVPNTIKSMIFNRIPEALCLGLLETTDGHFSIQGLDYLNLDSYDAVGIGPGIGRWDEEKGWLHYLLKNIKKPIVIDADGINILAKNLEILSNREYDTILTPHPGEMSRLISKSVDYVQKNRVQVALDFATQHKVYLVLKGANTVITTPDGEVYINSTGGPELSKGGSGDVLTGIIVGLLAQGLSIKNSIISAVFIHGSAGTLATNTSSNYSIIATDIIEQIGIAINKIMSNHA